ncbi:MerR family transcriptional regulator [Streptomyces sp. NPDC087300]|uniref:MerR family transcriptional regulator n=1 Tax=Streptomyces sp. NPDC087300 TaxID=3365780 RepID=UPI0038040AF3
MDDLASIRQVADHFDLPVSTLHYWERRGLVTPRRRFGQRYYDADQIYRVALIRLWRTTGQMPLNEIIAVLAEPADTSDWRDTVTARIAAIEAQLTRLDTACGYLRELLACPHDAALEQCEGFRARIALPPKGRG